MRSRYTSALARGMLVGVPCIALLATTAGADTVNVPDPDNGILTIQDGVDAALPGDEVLVAIGTWTGPGNRDVVVGVPITVRGVGGRMLTTIDCELAGRAFLLNAEVTIDGFTVINGFTSGEGGAILVDGVDASIIDCAFQDNTAESTGTGTPLNFFSGNGGAIAFANGGGGHIDDCAFSGNRAIATAGDPDMFPTGDILSGVGGAILVPSGSQLLIENSVFAGNEAIGPGLVGNGFGGAIGTDLFTSAPASLEILHCDFIGNTAQIAGGAMFLFGAHVATVGDTSFSANSAQSGGAIGYQTGMDLTVDDCSFDLNFTVADITFVTPDAQEQIGGGAIAGGGNATLTLEHSSFNGNSSLAGRGGAVSIFDEGTATITDCTFTDNEAALAGGAVVSQKAPALDTDDDPTGPSTTTMTGCSFSTNRTPGLGGAVANLEGSFVTATDCSFDANVAESPGAGGVQPFLGNGGAVASDGTTTLTDCELTGNRAVASGDILAGSGGAIFAASGRHLTVTGCTFGANEASSAGVIGNGFGGAISTDLLNAAPATLVIEESSFAGNSASIAGGALFLFGAHTVTIDPECLFVGNFAQSGGAVAYQTGVNLAIREAEFIDNYTIEQITFLLPDVQEQIGGGAIGGGGGATLTLEESSFSGNVSRAGRGGAVSTFDEGVATITDCEFTDNEAALAGGAVVSQQASALATEENPTGPSTTTMTDCTFTSNRTPGIGGAVACLEASSVEATTCDFDANVAESPGAGGVQPFLGNGGAIACGGTVVIDMCGFTDNQAIASGDILSGSGGAVFVSSGANVEVRSSVFDDNAALSAGVIGNGFGGAISTDLLNAAPATLLVQGSSFTGNHAAIAGGAMFLFGAHQITIEDGSSFEGNWGQSSGAIAFQTGTDLQIRDASFVGNHTLAEITFLFANVQEQIGGGAIGGGGGGASLLIEGTAFYGNEAVAGRGGALSVFGEATARVMNSDFRGNMAALEGGAIVSQEANALSALGPTGPTTMSLTNCLVACNAAGLGGGGVANLEGSWLRSSNCTIAHNASSSGAGGLESVGEFQPPPPNEVDPPPAPLPSRARVTNGILWGNESSAGLGAVQIVDNGFGEVLYSLVEGGWPGNGNIDADPMFEDTGELDGDPVPCLENDYRLMSGSPAIDAGNNWGVPLDVLDVDDDGVVRELMPVDLDGMPRFNADELDFDPGCGVPVVVDMGAYELQLDPVDQVLFADTDGNGAVDVDDLVEVIGAWGACEEDCCIADFNIDGEIDVDDLLAVILFWS